MVQAAWDKYTRVKVDREKEQASTDEEIRIARTGSCTQYVAYAGKVFKELEKKYCVLKATGQALPTAVLAAEIIKRRIPGLHQETKMGSREVIDKYEPKEEGLEVLEQKRFVTWLEIKLSLDAPTEAEAKAPGYQAPLPEDQVNEVEDMRNRPDRKSKEGDDSDSGSDDDDDEEKPKRKRGKGKGKKGKGKGKKGKGKGEDGEKKGKGKRGSRKGKGKKGRKSADDASDE